MTRFLIVRHGETDWNAGRRVQGQADLPLSEAGYEQSREAARALTDFRGPVASSALKRAVQTAETIADALDLGSVHVDPALNEFDAGEWTGLTREEIEAGWPEESVAWGERRLAAFPGGESRAEHFERILGGLGRLSEEHGESDVLVIAHGGVLGSIERALDCLGDLGYPHLSGRWFTLDGALEPGDRVELVQLS